MPDKLCPGSLHRQSHSEHNVTCHRNITNCDSTLKHFSEHRVQSAILLIALYLAKLNSWPFCVYIHDVMFSCLVWLNVLFLIFWSRVSGSNLLCNGLLYY